MVRGQHRKTAHKRLGACCDYREVDIVAPKEEVKRCYDANQLSEAECRAWARSKGLSVIGYKDFKIDPPTGGTSKEYTLRDESQQIKYLREWGLTEKQAEETCSDDAACRAYSWNPDDWTFFYNDSEPNLVRRGDFGRGWTTKIKTPGSYDPNGFVSYDIPLGCSANDPDKRRKYGSRAICTGPGGMMRVYSRGPSPTEARSGRRTARATPSRRIRTCTRFPGRRTRRTTSARETRGTRFVRRGRKRRRSDRRRSSPAACSTATIMMI